MIALVFIYITFLFLFSLFWILEYHVFIYISILFVFLIFLRVKSKASLLFLLFLLIFWGFIFYIAVNIWFEYSYLLEYFK